MSPRRLLLICTAAIGFANPSRAVILLETGDPSRNTTTPGDNSGWQYEGRFNDFLGVPIAPHFFITAAHIGGSVGAVLDFHGDSYTTIAVHPSPDTDLQIWEVDHSKPFPTFAPLASATGDTMTTATIIGRGTQRGVPVMVGEALKGWKWGTGDGVQRWGRNKVEGSLPPGTGHGVLIYCNFNSGGLSDECHLSVGDSGGGMFVLENGLWRLAGINYAVEGPFRHDLNEAPFDAALFDMGGLEVQDPNWGLLDDEDDDIPSGMAASRISASLTWIQTVTGEDDSLPDESYAAWQKLYFTPTQIGNPATTGPMADFDGDGIGNLLEFALNLDPSFNERATMISTTGLRGLPLVTVETISGADHLTIEFVRRTSTSGAGLTYTPQFSSDLSDWEAGGTATVAEINPRWERVKIVDPVTTAGGVKRFARLKLEMAD